MMHDPETGVLQPLNFKELLSNMPDLKRFGFNLSTISFDPPVDSANVNTDFWVKLASTIEENYNCYDGFVVLHGTDTMAYSASALSFMLENLQKPVIFTGSQLPIGMLRTDGKENLVTSIEIAAEKQNDVAVVPEVCIYFENKLFRGNRTSKYSAEHFNAFRSVNYPALAEAGIHIKYSYGAIQYPTIARDLTVNYKMDNNIGLLKLFPGISYSLIDSFFNTSGIKAVILETFGAGNAPTDRMIINRIARSIDEGIIVLNVSQCFGGGVQMGMYETSIALRSAGVLSGYDSTTEAALTKLMYLLGLSLSYDEIYKNLDKSLRGEITIY